MALVVAIDRYDDPSLQELTAPAADAEALVEVFGDPDLGGFDVDVVHNCPSWVVSQRVVVLLDCCYGGAFARGVVARAGGGIDVGDQFVPGGLGEGRGRAVITAS